MNRQAEYWYKMHYARRGGKTEAMRNWVRDKFGSNRVRTNPSQEERLAPVAVAPVSVTPAPHGLLAANWINNATTGTYAGINRSNAVMWSSRAYTSFYGTSAYYTAWDEYHEPKPTYSSKIALPEGI